MYICDALRSAFDLDIIRQSNWYINHTRLLPLLLLLLCALWLKAGLLRWYFYCTLTAMSYHFLGVR